MRKSPIRKIGKSDVSKTKRKIQALLRESAILRDGGCVLRTYPQAGECSEILQAEHLVTRARSVSFGDMRNIICLCQKHHIFWKPQNSRLYWEIVQEVVGPKRWEWIKIVEADRKPYHMTLFDWEMVATALRKDLEEARQ